LYVLLPADLAPPFDVFAVGCIAAVILGVVSHAPGGIGVFEASMTAILAGRGRPDLLAALLLFRLLYNLLPFALAVLVLGGRSGCRSLAARVCAQSRRGT
jgi:phosphatidylglycerol lysyltransferase